ncbi:unnamed protein product [Ectocarpus sp. 12 AP-2014]
MVLFLTRLLQVTEDELATFNPSTCTGRACSWIMQNCKGGRSGEQCSLYGEPLSHGTNVVRKMRDPRRGFDDDVPAKVQGVTAIDRMQDFNPHRSGGKWDELKLHFDAGKLLAFMDCAWGPDNRAVAMITFRRSCVMIATCRFVVPFPFRVFSVLTVLIAALQRGLSLVTST